MSQINSLSRLLVICLIVIGSTLSTSALAKKNVNNLLPDTLLSMLVEITEKQNLNLVISPEAQITHRINIRKPIKELQNEKELLILNDILNTLEVHAIKSGNTLKILPLKDLKKLPGKIYTEQANLDANEWVYSMFKIKPSVCVGRLVPMLRTLLPHHAHLAQSQQDNSMIIFDRRANIDKIRTLIRAIESNTANAPDCNAEFKVVNGVSKKAN